VLDGQALVRSGPPKEVQYFRIESALFRVVRPIRLLRTLSLASGQMAGELAQLIDSNLSLEEEVTLT
jgi:hypothetical protein